MDEPRFEDNPKELYKLCRFCLKRQTEMREILADDLANTDIPFMFQIVTASEVVECIFE